MKFGSVMKRVLYEKLDFLLHAAINNDADEWFCTILIFRHIG
ncbi:hypothetical protein [Photobacterium profundum]|nr:hypothetical protein [Photobacterium profundum]